MAAADDLARWLADLDLSRLALSAEITATGEFKPVGGMPSKLSAAAEAALRDGTLEVVGIAKGQPFPDAFRNLDHLRVEEASSLPELVEKLYEQYGARAALRRFEQERSSQLDLPGRGMVPLQQLYQELPLLREIPASELPSSRGENKESAEDAPDTRLGWLRLMDIQQWEEQQARRDQTVFERHAWRTVFDDFRRVAPKASGDAARFALLGPPGGGKSTFVQFLAHTAASGELRRPKR